MGGKPTCSRDAEIERLTRLNEQLAERLYRAASALAAAAERKGLAELAKRIEEFLEAGK